MENQSKTYLLDEALVRRKVALDQERRAILDRHIILCPFCMSASVHQC